MLRFVTLASAILMNVSAFAAAAPQTPVETIKALYAADAPFWKGTGEGLMGDDKARARFFSKAVLAALKKDEADADKRGEPPTIEGDPFTDSQEPGSKDFKYTLVSATATSTAARLRCNNTVAGAAGQHGISALRGFNREHDPLLHHATLADIHCTQGTCHRDTPLDIRHCPRIGSGPRQQPSWADGFGQNVVCAEHAETFLGEHPNHGGQ